MSEKIHFYRTDDEHGSRVVELWSQRSNSDDLPPIYRLLLERPSFENVADSKVRK